LLSYTETPLLEIVDPFIREAVVRLLIKREDLNHPEVSGNKWWKLKYNIEKALEQKSGTLLTFGGAYSNHIFATAAAAAEMGLKSIGIIRGEETLPLNSTLSFAKSRGMRLHYVSREEYRRKGDDVFKEELRKQFGEFYLIPEGGTNELAVQGCSEFAEKILSEAVYDYLCLPVGTGGTMAGIIRGLNGNKRVIGFSSLKGGSFLEDDIRNLLGEESKSLSNWEIRTEYHFGGYAKSTSGLQEFILREKKNHRLLLDEVYTSKMMFGIYDMISKSKFERGSVILAIHTGGLQEKK
jgi:1-aminocyclopropane-1-carboxylate deaminase